jgi:hypothetical protein
MGPCFRRDDNIDVALAGTTALAFAGTTEDGCPEIGRRDRGVKLTEVVVQIRSRCD